MKQFNFIHMAIIAALSFLAGFYIAAHMGKNRIEILYSRLVQCQQALEDFKCPDVTYQELDRDLCSYSRYPNMTDTLFSDTVAFRFGNHPGHSEWDSLKVTHKIQITKLN